MKKFKRINEETSKLAQLGFYEIVTTQEADKLYVSRFTNISKLPTVIAVLVGESAYQIRSSLDHIAFAVVKPKTPKEEQQCHFPICDTAHKLSIAYGKMPSLCVKAKGLIESVQPYGGGQLDYAGRSVGERLWDVHEINNWDKHRAVLLCAPVTGDHSGSVSVLIPTFLTSDTIFALLKTTAYSPQCTALLGRKE